MKTGTIQISIGAEVTVGLPVTWRYKHYTPEETQAVVDEFVRKLGYEYGYLVEDEES